MKMAPATAAAAPAAFVRPGVVTFMAGSWSGVPDGCPAMLRTLGPGRMGPHHTTM
jgi:hypothetical protein